RVGSGETSEGVMSSPGRPPALFGGAHLPERLNDESGRKFPKILREGFLKVLGRKNLAGEEKLRVEKLSFRPRGREACDAGGLSGRASAALRGSAGSAARRRGR